MFRGFISPLGQGLIWSATRDLWAAVVKAPSPTRWSQVIHYFFERCRYCYTSMLSDWSDGAVAWRRPMNIARNASLV